MKPARWRQLMIATALCFTAAPGIAQRDSTVRVDTRWRAYLGCWSTVAVSTRGPDVCLIPTTDSTVVDLVVVRNDSVLSSTPVTSAGTRVPRTRDGCVGWESGRWSADERRLYTETEFTCAGKRSHSSSGIYAMALPHTFARIEGARTPGAEGVQLIRFATLPYVVTLPDSLDARMPAADERAFLARVEAAAELSTADVADAAQAVDVAVAEAWIADRKQRFALTARDARALRDAKVPGRVIDMMVVVSHPERFRVWENQPAQPSQPVPAAISAFSGISSAPALLVDRWQTGPAVNNASIRYLGSPLYDPRNPNIDCFSSLFCATGYTVPTTHVTFSIAPVVQSSPYEPNLPGRAVNGLGYTQGGGSSSGVPAPSMTAGGYTPASSSDGSSSAGGGGGAASNGGTEQRTAKPRP